MLFGSVPGGLINPTGARTLEVRTLADQTLKSIWFDADSGIFYRITGVGTLTLGDGLGNNEVVIGVASNLQSVTENNIENSIVLDNSVSGRNLWIVNDSLGGLRLGGPLDIGSQNLIVSNTGKPLARSAVHLNGAITGTGNISTVNGATQHLVLQADNSAWSGALNVGRQTLVFVKSNGALGTGTNIFTFPGGGTFGFRSHVGSLLNYNAPAQTLQVRGTGAVRTWGKPGVGAIYHDGGNNVFTGNIQLGFNSWIGARGDQGGLTLSGQISGGNYSFTKVGHGMIRLNNEKNNWSGLTTLKEGVLQINRLGALPASSNLQFDGGILALRTGSTSSNSTSSDFTLGTGPGQIRWLSTGGFSALGEAHSVTLNGGAQLTWGSGYFAGVSGTRELLLSSRYSNAIITFTNPTNLNHGWRAVRVERGLGVNGYAIISGAISSTGAANLQTGFYKMGLGLLWLTSTESTYYDKSGIHDGAIGGIPATARIDFSGYGPPESRGGVVALKEDFTRTLSENQGNNVSWHIRAKGGGFAAYGGDRTVRLNNSTTLINWHTGSFIKNGQVLKFGHYTSSGTILWDKQLGLGTNQSRVINIDRGLLNGGRADVSFTQALSGTGGSLTIQGDGRMDIAVDNPDLKLATINIFGAEFRLQQAASITAQATNFVLKNGGTLTLDNLGTHKATSGGSYNSDRIHNDSDITLNASTLRYRGIGNPVANTETVGKITLEDGANTIEINRDPGQAIGAVLLYSQDFDRSSSVATFNLRSDDMVLPNTATQPIQVLYKARLLILNGGSQAAWKAAHTVNDAGGGRIAPWATINGQDWLTADTPLTLNGTLLSSLPTYHTGAQDTWDPRHNVLLNSSPTLSGHRTINSLKLFEKGNLLNLDKYNLSINSGGLLSTGSISGELTGGGAVNSKRPLYVHVYSPALGLTNEARFKVDTQLIKTGGGGLVLASQGTHSMSELYIHQGTVVLQQGSINAKRIVIGDGAGKDIFMLPADRWNPLANKPNITLRGTPYGPGAEYASYNPDEAILQMGGNTKQYISTLRIEDRGTIDWVGGEVGKANMLFVDKLEFSPNGQLFMRNWYEYEDYLLVKKVGFNFGDLNKIVFDGLWDLSALAVHYDSQYYMITPYNSPEPSTYGAILGAVGIGLWTWRKRKQRQR